MSRVAAGEAGFFYVLQDELRILFADDDPILREFAVVHLTTESAQVVLAEDGADALRQVAATPPDILLLDLEMPNMDGFQVLERLRADPATRDLPVIVVTGREDVAAIDRAFTAGATSFLVKPLNWRLLSYQIRYVHRTLKRKAELRAASEAARAEADAAVAALMRLSQASARFLAEATAREPDLRQQAQVYASAIDDVALAMRRTG